MKYMLLFIFTMIFFVSCNHNSDVSTPLLDPSVLAGKTICIDPGHQENQNADLEPIAPNVSIQKPKVSAGTAGITTKMPEYVINLVVGLKLCSILESYGATVVMTRTTNDVNISNIERARIGNSAQGDIMIRIHADGSDNRSTKGVSVLIPSSTYIHNSSLLNRSKRAGNYILNRIISNTEAINRGIADRSDLSGFNWSEIPVILIEIGFLSNPEEDILLNTDGYQDKVVKGIFEGLVSYFMY